MITIVLIFIKSTLKAVRWEENTVEASAFFSAGQCKPLCPQFYNFGAFLKWER